MSRVQASPGSLRGSGRELLIIHASQGEVLRKDLPFLQKFPFRFLSQDLVEHPITVKNDISCEGGISCPIFR